MEAITEFIKTHSIILTVLIIGAVYFTAKYFCFSGYPAGLELFTLFLLYEFGSLKKILKDIHSNLNGFHFFVKVLTEKYLGRVTIEDIVKSMSNDREDGND